MQIVINIDEEVYKRTLPYKDLPIISNLANDYDEITHAVANGVILPKGHGALKDSDLLDTRLNFVLNHTGGYKNTPIGTGIVIAMAENLDAKTIIEADKAESEV